MKKFSIPNDLLSTLHFVNGAMVGMNSGGGGSGKFKVIEPRNGKDFSL
jgi:hypothetical protein